MKDPALLSEEGTLQSVHRDPVQEYPNNPFGALKLDGILNRDWNPNPNEVSRLCFSIPCHPKANPGPPQPFRDTWQLCPFIPSWFWDIFLTGYLV